MMIDRRFFFTFASSFLILERNYTTESKYMVIMELFAGTNWMKKKKTSIQLLLLFGRVCVCGYSCKLVNITNNNGLISRRTEKALKLNKDWLHVTHGHSLMFFVQFFSFRMKVENSIIFDGSDFGLNNKIFSLPVRCEIWISRLMTFLFAGQISIHHTIAIINVILWG